MKQSPRGPSYRWQGLDTHGRRQQGVLQAGNAQLAHALLRRQAITVHKLERQWWAHTTPIPSQVIAAMTRQWAVLIQAGVSLAPALQMLQRSATRTDMATLLGQILEDVENGLALAQALGKHPGQFSPLYISMVHAGETAGILETMMERLAQTLEKNEALRSKVRSALAYPLTVVAIAVAVLMLILLYVVPVFEDVFRSFGAELPWSTRAVLALSQSIGQGAGWIALLSAPAAWLLHRQWQNPGWQRQWHRRVLAWPGIGPLIRTSVLARWAHTLSALLAAGVPLTEALPVAGRATGHPVYERINEHLQRRVAQGGRLSEGMAHTGRFPDMLVQMCATGEDTGTLDTLLNKAAALMAEELDARVHALTSLLEPLIVVLLGGAIGVILVAMYLPIFRLGQVF